MNKNEIVVGAEYAYTTYASSRDYNGTSVKRVRVTGAPIKPEPSYSWDRDKAWRVPVVEIFKDGTEGKTLNVRTREIKEPWADFAAWLEEKRLDKIAADVRRAEAQRIRIKEVLTLVKDLRAAGVPEADPPWFSIDSDKELDTFEGWGFIVKTGTKRGGDTVRYVAEPLWSTLEDYIKGSDRIRIDFSVLADLAKVAAR